MGGLVSRPHLIRRCARIRAISAAYGRKFYWKALKKKNALAGASGGERTAREKKGADHRPRARQWPGYVLFLKVFDGFNLLGALTFE